MRGMGIHFLSALSILGMEIWVSARRFCNINGWNNNDCFSVHYVYLNTLLYFDFINVFAKERLVLFTAEKHSTNLD